MRNRNVRIQFRLDEKEAEAFNKRVKKSGVNRENYMRHLINDLLPMEVPPPDFYSMLNELHAIGNNLNQIARKAHVLNVIDVQRYNEVADRLSDATVNIMNAVMLPREMK